MLCCFCATKYFSTSFRRKNQYCIKNEETMNKINSFNKNKSFKKTTKEAANNNDQTNLKIYSW